MALPRIARVIGPALVLAGGWQTPAQAQSQVPTISVGYARDLAGFWMKMKPIRAALRGWVLIDYSDSIFRDTSPSSMKTWWDKHYLTFTVLVSKQGSGYVAYLNDSNYRYGMDVPSVDLQPRDLGELAAQVTLLALENYATKEPRQSKDWDRVCVARYLLVQRIRFRPPKVRQRGGCTRERAQQLLAEASRR